MLNTTRILSAIAIAYFTAIPGLAQDNSADMIVATVNGTEITVGHMIVLRNNLPEQYDNLEDKVLFDGILDQIVQQTILAQTITSPTKATVIEMENQNRALLAGVAMTGLLEEAVTDEVIEAAYNEQYADIERPREFNASHILVETEEEALALVIELENGADFAALASEHSTGPSGPNGGQLGWFGPGMMVAPFEQAVLEMEDGQVSPPVQTQFGWHVIILNETRIPSAPAIDEVRAEIAEELQQAALAKIVESLTASADVSRVDLSEIDPAILRDIDLVLDR
ncbi:MAG: peptidylprolyl isomerase [Paracoccaceae bacterium]